VGSCARGDPGTTKKFDLCPLFTDTPAPFGDFQAEDTAVWPAGFRYVVQISHSELFESMNGRPVLRIGQAEQSAAIKLFEPERKLGLADLGGNAPAPGLTRKYKADLEVVCAKCCAWK
jgi:hypothetical protein